MTASVRPRLVARFDLSASGVARGVVFDPDDPAARFVVEILADGLPVALLRADGPEGEGEASLGNDGCYAFSVPISDAVLACSRRLSARLANSDTTIGTVETGDWDRRRAQDGKGHAHWAGGLRITGHVTRDGTAERLPTVRAVIEGTEVARMVCRSWCQRENGEAAHAFDLRLPEFYADGRVRPVEILTKDDELPGSPCLVVAYPDALADWIDGVAELDSEKVRARFADGLLPRSIGFDALQEWIGRFPLPRPETAMTPRIAVAIVGKHGLEATIASLESQEGVDWSAAALTGAASRIGFDPRHLRSFLEQDAADCGFVVMAVSGATFAPQALRLMSEAAEAAPRAKALYPDLVVATADGARWPLAFPAYDDELFLEQAYCGLVYAVRRDIALERVDRCRTLFALFPAEVPRDPASAPIHLPALLATIPEELPTDDLRLALAEAATDRLGARGVEATVEAGSTRGARPTIRIGRCAPAGEVAVLIAVRDDGPALARTLASLRTVTPRPRIILADNDSRDTTTLEVLGSAAREGCLVLPTPGWFCVPQLLNQAAAAADSDFLLFLDSGVAPLADDWLKELLGRMAAQACGAVGGLVAWTTGIVRDAGSVLGPRLSAVPRFTDRLAADAGYAGLLDAAHACSALSASCLLTPRRLFTSLGGFNVTRFPTSLYAEDYCLRVREAGQRVLFTPHARFEIDGGPRMPADCSSLCALLEREHLVFRHRWSVAPGCDPFYSPWMAMDGAPYSGLAWRPAPYRPRQPDRPVARRLPHGF